MKARDVVVMGLATALTVVVSAFSFKIVIPGFFPVKITFSLIVVFFVSVKFGPLRGAVVAALAHLIQSLVLAKGSLFPGFILTDFLSGLVIGYSFRLVHWGFKFKGREQICSQVNQHKISFVECLVCVSVTKLITCFVNTLWLCVLLHAPFCFLFFPRFLAAVVMIVIITPVVYGLFKFVKHMV